MSECLKMVEQTLVVLLNAVRDAHNRDWAKLVPETIAVLRDVWDDYECFTHCANFQSVSKGILSIIGDQKECIMVHLQAAWDEVQKVPAEVWHGDWDAVNTSLDKVLGALQAVLQCQ